MTGDAAVARDEPATSDAPAVLVCSTSTAAERHALDHAARLFGPDHRFVSDEMDLRTADPRVVCARVAEVRAISVVLGLDVNKRDRGVPSFAHRLVRRCPCPVILVAVDADDGSADDRSDVHAVMRR